MIPNRFIESSPDPAGAVATIVFVGYLLMLAAGLITLLDPATMDPGYELNWGQAVFTLFNAATLTGFPQDLSDEFLPQGQRTIFALMVGGALFTLLFGGLAVVRILGLPYRAGKVVAATLLFFCIFVGGGATAVVPGFDPEAMCGAVFQSVSAFANSGLHLGPLPGLPDWRVHVVLLPLAFVGGLGLPVLMELFMQVHGRTRLTLHTRAVLIVSIGLYLGGMGLFVLLQWMEMQTESWRTLLADGSAAALNVRTAGFPFQDPAAHPRAMQWLIMLLMMIGASPAGTGGGVKTAALAMLIVGVRRSLRGEMAGRAFGIAGAWLGTYLLIAFGCLMGLLMTQHGVPADDLLFLAVSAASNVGLAAGSAEVGGAGTWILSAAMLLGRIVPLLILWQMAATTFDAEIAPA